MKELKDTVENSRAGYKQGYSERKQKKSVPVWEKYLLSVEQAADYFGIGQKKLRSLIFIYQDASWHIMNGERTMIKRKKFEEFLDETECI